MHSFLTTCSFSKKKKKQDTKSHSIIHIRNYTLQKAIIHAEVTNYLGFISLPKGARRTIDTTKNSYWHPILHFIARLHTEVCTRLVASWIATRRVSREHRLFNCNAWLIFTPSRGEKKKKEREKSRRGLWCRSTITFERRKTPGSRENEFLPRFWTVSPSFDPVLRLLPSSFLQAKSVFGVECTKRHETGWYWPWFIFALQCEFLLEWNFIVYIFTVIYRIYCFINSFPCKSVSISPWDENS